MAALSSIPISTLPLLTKSTKRCFSRIFPTQFLRIPDPLTFSYQRRRSWIIGSVAEELESKGHEIVSLIDGLEEPSSSSAPVEEKGDAFDRLNSRTVNAAIVLGFGTFIVTKLLTIDHEYWHGWTLFEVLRYVPEHNWIAYEEALKTNPVLAKMVISGVVYSLGDWIAQCYEGKLLFEFDRTRVFRSGLVGFILHGSLSHYYYQFCEALIPSKDWWGVPAKVAFDQTFWSAVWNSIYFVVLGILRGESLANSFSKLKPTFWSMLTAGWKLWPFAHLITYGLIPIEQRLLWVDCVELIWVTILSSYSTRNQNRNYQKHPRLLRMISSPRAKIE